MERRAEAGRLGRIAGGGSSTKSSSSDPVRLLLLERVTISYASLRATCCAQSGALARWLLPSVLCLRLGYDLGLRGSVGWENLFFRLGGGTACRREPDRLTDSLRFWIRPRPSRELELFYLQERVSEFSDRRLDITAEKGNE